MKKVFLLSSLLMFQKNMCSLKSFISKHPYFSCATTAFFITTSYAALLYQENKNIQKLIRNSFIPDFLQKKINYDRNTLWCLWGLAHRNTYCSLKYFTSRAQLRVIAVGKKSNPNERWPRGNNQRMEITSILKEIIDGKFLYTMHKIEKATTLINTALSIAHHYNKFLDERKENNPSTSSYEKIKFDNAK